MNIIKVKDYDSMQAITVSLAKNGYLVTADSVTDEHYKEHWEIKYCDLSEITEKLNNGSDGDFDGDYLGSMEINNKKSTKDVKCEILPDEKPLVENEKDTIDLNPVKSVQKHKKQINILQIPKQDTSDNITDESMTVITSVSGN